MLHETAKLMVGMRKDKLRSCIVRRNRKEVREWVPKKRFHSTFECRGFLKLCFSCNRDSYSWGLCCFCLLAVSSCDVLTAFWRFIQVSNWNLMNIGLIWVTWSFGITHGWQWLQKDTGSNQIWGSWVCVWLGLGGGGLWIRRCTTVCDQQEALFTEESSYSAPFEWWWIDV